MFNLITINWVLNLTLVNLYVEEKIFYLNIIFIISVSSLSLEHFVPKYYFKIHAIKLIHLSTENMSTEICKYICLDCVFPVVFETLAFVSISYSEVTKWQPTYT